MRWMLTIERNTDEAIIESLNDPPTHLVRNSIDHGIELPEDRVKAGKNRVGRLTLRAFHDDGQVSLEIADDAAGLNCERIRQKAVGRGLISADQASRLTERETFRMIFGPAFLRRRKSRMCRVEALAWTSFKSTSKKSAAR
jgi:two-component system chemotaxis sensor kinase CheA